MGIIQEFKQFAVKGNVIDLAVGVIIGGAFGKIVSSLVADIIMPPLGVILGGINFRNLSLVLSRTHDGVPAVTLNYGIFIQNTVDFIIISIAIFLLVKAINTFRRRNPPAPAPPPPPSREEILLAEIRDLRVNGHIQLVK